MELYNDDCFNVFPEIKDNSIDLFVLDLPYANFKFGKCTACKWDLPIDLDKMWIEIKRMMKPNAVIVFFCNTKFGYALIDSNPKWFKYDLIWKKNKKVGFLSANKQPLRQHENIYVFNNQKATYNPQKTEGKEYNKYRPTQNILTKNGAYGKILKQNKEQKVNDRHPSSILPEIELEEHENVYIFNKQKATYNPQKTEGKPYNKTNTGKNIDSMAYSNHSAVPTASINGDRHPSSILPDDLESTILQYNNPHKPIHRTQKPEKLLEWLIKSYSNENDIVMDFCMGSGTAGVACKNTNRQFIGIEKDEEIFDLACERLNL
jgi:site-specific DNA-methyltransferase (adenine-specific)